MSVILVTHDLGVVAQSCDRVAVMYAGRIMETAPVRDLFRAPRHAYTAGLLGAVPSSSAAIRAPLRSIDGAPPPLTNLPDACAFAPRCWLASAACLGGRPPLVWLGPERATACIHHERVAG